MPHALNSKPLFKDRDAAAEALREAIPSTLFDLSGCIVVGIGAGGIYIADKISRAFGIEMDMLLTEPIKAPNNPELVVAIVSETEDLVMNRALVEAFEIDEDYLYSEANRKYEEAILASLYRYRKGIPMRSLEGRQVILVDEAIETGLTMSVAIKSIIEKRAKSIYVAVPLLDQTLYGAIENLCDGLFSPNRIRDYISIEYYYEKLDELDFESVEKILELQGVTRIKEH